MKAVLYRDSFLDVMGSNLIAPHCNNLEKEKENFVQCTGLIIF